MIETVAAATAAVVALPVVGALGYRAVRRSATAKQLAITTPNGIAEEHYLRVGGVEQWVQIRGEDRANPVLFVLHGGPGSPYAVFTPLIRSWEKHFTVVQWDRRGVGKTRARSGPADPAVNTFAQLADDAVEVIDFVRAHLDQDKVVLLAGSMGTMLGLPLARRRPDLFSALVCTDLYADMYRNEQDGYRQALERVRAAGNTKAIAALEKIGDDPNQWDLRAWQVKMDVTMKTDPVTPNGVAKLLFPLAMTSPLYSLSGVKHLLAGFMDTQKQMHDEVMRYDAYAGGTRFEVPFFLLQGASDVLTLTEPAVEFFERVEAPVKAMALIEDASHFAAFTQPDRFLTQLLKHVRPMVTAS
ncbi:MAG: alpha/beta hydrolase [Hamadaea sp.]|nr:alpha/beta hydrolase [Hamadaea sp.]NUR49021.1 alpha/beta hydrolase [Hamadaea sp.]NUT04747.1 alpha/beta hydrolase [Hamadaea sp.]